MFWEMHDRLFENYSNLEPWARHAEALGLETAKFTECLESGRHVKSVRRDMAQAAKVGATGTPAFVLGITSAGDPTKVRGLRFIRGAQPFATFKATIDNALSSLAPKSGLAVK